LQTNKHFYYYTICGIQKGEAHALLEKKGASSLKLLPLEAKVYNACKNYNKIVLFYAQNNCFVVVL
jgi:hypothetical protein